MREGLVIFCNLSICYTQASGFADLKMMWLFHSTVSLNAIEADGITCCYLGASISRDDSLVFL